ncbi:di-trans,poly-cis-decaprenylcistransferase [Candidatus Parcubacteria bacterium]|nr:di-trans,poly-cis-decaprenylcistransferase [Candidatus Parcubacteria bacterium]
MITHLALIPDGNRRWAKKRGFLPWQGHVKGAKNLEKILKKVWELKIPYFTFWGMSADNFSKRPKEEVKMLLQIFKNYFSKILKSKEPKEKGIKINVFGKWKEVFPPSLKETIKKVIEKTKNNQNFVLTFLLAYNGTDEMLEAIAKIVKKAKKENFKITEKILLENLWTGSLPPVDLVIRTGCQGDPHNSAGFMMWLTSYSQLYFTKTLFPDFSPQELEMAIKNFEKRERRMGA